MSRLTARTETGHAYLVNVKPDEQEVDSPYKNTLQCILDCFERLAQYEDAEEQGRCVVLPCKVGDVLYKPYRDGIDCGDIHHVNIDIESDIGSFEPSDIGKTVFLTRELAEEALKNVQEKPKNNNLRGRGNSCKNRALRKIYQVLGLRRQNRGI